MQSVGIIDYGMGNVGSIENMIRHLGGQAEFVRQPDALSNYEKIILPGVGRFGEAMRRLSGEHWDTALIEARDRGVWILGICLGMQLLVRSSEEDECPGLGWFDLPARKIPLQLDDGPRRRVPHMGWNEVQFRNSKLSAYHKFYFVHSYYLPVEDSTCWAVTDYEGFQFASAIRNERVMGVQFHPEKSHRYGKTFLRHFMNLGVME